MTTMGIIGAQFIHIEEICMYTNEKSSNPAVWPRVACFIRILWTTCVTASFKRSSTPLGSADVQVPLTD